MNLKRKRRGPIIVDTESADITQNYSWHWNTDIIQIEIIVIIIFKVEKVKLQVIMFGKEFMAGSIIKTKAFDFVV